MAGKNTRAEAAADRKAEAESGTQNPHQHMLDALAIEREGYVRRGLKARVAQVDAQIKHYGGKSSSRNPAIASEVAAEPAEPADAPTDSK
jgi:hypothetical protein